MFKYFQELITNIFCPSPHGPHENPQTSQVVGVTKYEGDKTAFGNMVPGDQALMYGLLYGATFNIAEVPRLRGKVLFTNLGGNSFALTDFNHGTFVFPVDDAASAKRQKSAGCGSFKHRLNSEIYITSA